MLHGIKQDAVMPKIVFERKKNVYLPEIDAYMAYLRERHPHVDAIDSGDASVDGADVIWRFTGFDRSPGAAHGARIVHEYGSLSVPPYARLKNKIKKWVNARPAQRVFLNGTVRQEFGFSDGVPAHLRDMGITAAFFGGVPAAPDYDFVYCGSLYRGPEVLQFLHHFASANQGKILVIGTVRAEDEQALARSGNITFTGRVNYADIPALIRRARYGLNIIPDVYPFNIQTSTKILEYAAAGLSIISNDYAWVRRFEAERRAKFFYLPKDLNDFSIAALESYPFIIPDVRDLEWSGIIERSGIFDFLNKDVAL